MWFTFSEKPNVLSGQGDFVEESGKKYREMDIYLLKK